MYGGTKRKMDLLGPWLATTIEGELSEALRHWKEGTNRIQSVDKSQGLSYDDGSNLRIRSAKKGPVVQITKVGKPPPFPYVTNNRDIVPDL